MHLVPRTPLTHRASLAFRWHFGALRAQSDTSRSRVCNPLLPLLPYELVFNHSTHMTLLALFAPVTASHAAVASASATTNCLTDLDFSTASTAVRRKTAGPHKHVLPYGAQGRRGGYTTVVARHLERLTEACHDRTRGESKCATARRQHQASTSQHRVV